MIATPTTVTTRSPRMPPSTPPTIAPTAIASVNAVRTVEASAAVPNRTRFTNTGPPMMAVARV